uniref:Uncharacterized protein n=1 Tax=Macrostomum lignano TaxID=282301 RepID=A0A1I8FM40_9PLAT
MLGVQQPHHAMPERVGTRTSRGPAVPVSCPATFVGPRCQVYRPVLPERNAGPELIIIAEQFLRLRPFGRPPSGPPLRRPGRGQAINAFCTASEANFALCCPSAAARQTPSADKKLIADADVGYPDNEDMFTDDCRASRRGCVRVYANSSSTANTLCPAGQAGEGPLCKPWWPSLFCSPLSNSSTATGFPRTFQLRIS